MTETSHQEYRDRADECERLANIATNAEVRETLRYLAKRWMDFAGEAEFKLEQRNATAPPKRPIS